jgi:serine/threonine-protein kinase HipA
VTYSPVDVVEVLAWGERVGVVARDPSTRWYAFEYARNWIDGGVELAPLHMPLRAAPYSFPDLAPETFLGLPPLLADALPDAFGNALVNRWMAEQGIPASRISPLDRLAYAADRGMGALEFRPPARVEADHLPTAVQLADLVVAARLTVHGEFGGDEVARAALQQLIHVGTSAGGARPKAVLAYNPATSQIMSAYAPAAPGYEQWLIKLDGVGNPAVEGDRDSLGASAPYGRTEYAYALMAAAAGVEMAEVRLLAEGPRRHFLTKRFDRTEGNRRHHVLSLCAMAHLDYNLVGVHSYDQLFLTLRALGMDDRAMSQAYRRMVFNVAAVNHDDHTKNIAFLRPQGGEFELAPAFDLTHAHRPESRWTNRQSMLVNGKDEGIELADLYSVGERHDVPACRRIVREVQDAVAEWPNYAAEAELDLVSSEAIARDHELFRPR